MNRFFGGDGRRGGVERRVSRSPGAIWEKPLSRIRRRHEDATPIRFILPEIWYLSPRTRHATPTALPPLRSNHSLHCYIRIRIFRSAILENISGRIPLSHSGMASTLFDFPRPFFRNGVLWYFHTDFVLLANVILNLRRAHIAGPRIRKPRVSLTPNELVSRSTVHHERN